MSTTVTAAPTTAAGPLRGSAPLPGAALVLGSVVSIQVGAAIAVSAFPQAGPVGTSTLRLAFAAAVLLVVGRPRLRGLSRADLLVAAASGLVMATMNTLVYLSIERLPMGPAITLEFLGPLVLALVLSRRWTDAVWAACAGAGVVLLGSGMRHGDPGGLDLVGVAFALGAGACWAGHILINAQLGRRFRGPDGLALGAVVGTLAILPFGVATTGTVLLEPPVLLLGLAIGVLSTALPYSLDVLALRRLRSGVFGILMSLNPAAAALAGLALLDQLLSARQVLAIALVVVASAGATATGRRRAAAEPGG